MSTNPFMNLTNLDEVEVPKPLPLQRGLIATVKEAGARATDNGTVFMYLRLYFPEFNHTQDASWAMTDSEGSKRMIGSVLATLDIPFNEAEKHLILERLEAVKGWTLKVDHLEGKAKDKDGNPYKNLYIREVIQKVEPEIPF